MNEEYRPNEPTPRSDACTTGLPGSQPEACGTGYTGIPTAEPAFSESAVPPGTPIPAATTFTGKTRRIGTITFGIALIFSGIFCLLCLFVPDFDFLSVLRYAPVLLVFLGIEILVSHFLYPGHRMKYDFLSGFFCFLLICGSVCASIVAPLYEQYGPNRFRTEQALSADIDEACYQALKGHDDILDLQSYVDLNGRIANLSSMTYQDLEPADSVTLFLRFGGASHDPESFAIRCHETLQQLKQTGVAFHSLDMEWEGPDKSGKQYSLHLNNRFQKDLSVENLQELLSISEASE